ncbi:MAG: FAD-dependent oxidoreductase [Bacillota bacterium]|nr:FAD-dependent oxidoreductase [Bacillota bacterium]
MTHPRLPTRYHNVDVCVVGGGLAGIAAAISAARHGARCLIVQDRPMFGGNSSSEVRMWVSGARGPGNRETGILEEIALENLRRNPHKNFSVWDSILYEKVRFQPGLDYLLNTSCFDAEMAEDRIHSIRCWQLTTQTFHEIQARFFIDCSGDSILAPLTGAPWRHGREGQSEYGEDIAPPAADSRTMGSSCLIQLRETNDKRLFVAPDWALDVTADNSRHRPADPRQQGENFWYLELGGDRDTIADAEEIRDELQDLGWGFANFIKNRKPWRDAMRNYDVDWIGMLPGKRESRRYIGAHVMTQHDVRAGGRFPDIVAYGGWPMDDHHPAGYRTPAAPTIFHPAPSPFGIPWRCLYSVAVPNLLFAGRNISVTHTAMSSTRVMATCALLGQAAGTGAALALRHGCDPATIGERHITELQQALLTDDAWLPGLTRTIPELSQTADYVVMHAKSATSPAVLRDGHDRPDAAASHLWTGSLGSVIEMRFSKPETIHQIRMVFDSDLERETLPAAERRLNRSMESIYRLNQPALYLPHTLIRSWQLELVRPDGSATVIASEDRNSRRLVLLRPDSPWSGAVAVRLSLLESWGCREARLFSFDVS